MVYSNSASFLLLLEGGHMQLFLLSISTLARLLVLYVKYLLIHTIKWTHALCMNTEVFKRWSEPDLIIMLQLSGGTHTLLLSWTISLAGLVLSNLTVSNSLGFQIVVFYLLPVTCYFEVEMPGWLNLRPSTYKTDALPLSHTSVAVSLYPSTRSHDLKQ